MGFVGLLLSQLIRIAGTLTILTPETRQLGTRLAWLNYPTTFLSVAGMVLLMVAIFTDRERPEGLSKKKETLAA
jgi:hypothetical protein